MNRYCETVNTSDTRLDTNLFSLNVFKTNKVGIDKGVSRTSNYSRKTIDNTFVIVVIRIITYNNPVQNVLKFMRLRPKPLTL